MGKRRKSYTKSEKLEIIMLSIDGTESVEDLATRFEISSQSIYNWRSQYLKNGAASFPGKGNKLMTETERKMAELEKQLREVTIERDILKKAVGIFSKTNRKSSNL